MRVTAYQLAMRFGHGPSPAFDLPQAAADWIDVLFAPDPGLAFADPDPSATKAAMQHFVETNRARRAGEATDEDRRAAARALLVPLHQARQTALLRAAHVAVPLHDRLTEFWRDHFTVHMGPVRLRPWEPLFTAQAIRPHVAGRFADMLRAAVMHPAMLIYLDQTMSVGPNSPGGSGRDRGLNENLAREVLELHTLGAGGPYGQDDVRQLAELFTGMRAGFDGFEFRPHLAEPGAETVLGRSYGGADPARIEDITAALDDLAAHPATAAYIARKLAVHFTSDNPDAGLVRALEARFRDTEGDLASVTGVLIDHRASLDSFGQKARRPLDFVLGAVRALGPEADRLRAMRAGTVRDLFDRPLQGMGQAYRRAPGPDGWPETLEAWISPQGLAGRIGWAMAAPSEFRPDLPDPRGFVDLALGPLASEATRFAAAAAETRWEGVGLILSAPEFNRR